MLLAVYGSLKRGKGNHKYFLGEAEYIRTAEVNGFHMYSLGGFPGIKKGLGTIKVELYDNYNLKSIDGLESEGSMYRREVVHTTDGEPCFIYVYLHDVRPESKVEGGVW